MLVFFLAAGSFLLLDQWSKIAVRPYASDSGEPSTRLLHIRYVIHRKFFYRRMELQVLMVLAWLTALVSAILLHRSGAWFQNPAAMAGLGCAFGGAAGNLFDILRCR